MTDEKNSPVLDSEIIARMVEITNRRRELSAEDSILSDELEELESAVKARMAEQGVNRIASKAGSVSLKEQIVPQIHDRDAFEAWVLETGNLHLLQNRIAIGAFKEMVESGQEVPGLTPFTKISVNLRQA